MRTGYVAATNDATAEYATRAFDADLTHPDFVGAVRNHTNRQITDRDTEKKLPIAARRHDIPDDDRESDAPLPFIAEHIANGTLDLLVRFDAGSRGCDRKPAINERISKMISLTHSTKFTTTEQMQTTFTFSRAKDDL